MGKWIHRLKDIKDQIAFCEGCKVRLRIYRTSRGGWKCSNAHKLLNNRNRKQYRYPVNDRKQQLKKYGLTIPDFEELKKKQKDKCKICYEKKLLCVDHDHKTGKVRGLLCKGCNFAIGILKDDPELLKRAIKYLG